MGFTAAIVVEGWELRVASQCFLCPSDVLEEMMGAPIRQCYLAASSDLRQTINI